MKCLVCNVSSSVEFSLLIHKHSSFLKATNRLSSIAKFAKFPLMIGQHLYRLFFQHKVYNVYVVKVINLFLFGLCSQRQSGLSKSFPIPWSEKHSPVLVSEIFMPFSCFLSFF